MKKILVISACFALLGCQIRHEVNRDESFLSFNLHGFSIQYPTAAQYKINRPNGSVVFATTKEKDELNDYYISVNDSIMIPNLSTSCTPTLTGASSMTDIPDTGGETSWGKFDYEFSPDPKIGEGEFYCVPFKATPHVYVMCSEKDETTVLICVSQVTDNPDLAQEIFESFRWTE